MESRTKNKQTKRQYAFSQFSHTEPIKSTESQNHLTASDVFNTHCVEALKKVFRGQLTPAVLHVRAPVELSILTAYNTTSPVS